MGGTCDDACYIALQSVVPDDKEELQIPHVTE